ncbi:MAG: tRNA uridine-5-carboxymethylaminomethyl(34) synthesis GTPase MnmE [Gemmatimonadaceae bacterium]
MTFSPAVASSIVGARDTIAALSTAPGRSAIAIVRVSGSRAFEITQALVQPWPIVVRHVMLCRIFDELHRPIDEALVTTFCGPDSFTGEDLVELSTHGGPYITTRLIEALIAKGAREAQPGEFTRRAVLNGKLDITQAEAIGDLIDARSQAMHAAAIGQLDGGLRRRIEEVRNRLLSLAAMIAYDIDFPEEDDGPVPRIKIEREINRIVQQLDALLATVPVGEMIREGAIVVIAGETNAGKSSLFNALLGQSRAIVTEIPGTTRDAIEGLIDSAHWPLRLVDTAGFRETTDRVERMGIEVSERYLKRAHLILVCGESDDSISRTARTLEGNSTAAVLRVETKSDLLKERGSERPAVDNLIVSAETGAGLKVLLNHIDDALTTGVGSAVAETPVLTRARHVQGIEKARRELTEFAQLWRESNLPAPVAAVHLQTATAALEDLIGTVSTDDVLDRVFSAFCVGK